MLVRPACCVYQNRSLWNLLGCCRTTQICVTRLYCAPKCSVLLVSEAESRRDLAFQIACSSAWSPVSVCVVRHKAQLLVTPSWTRQKNAITWQDPQREGRGVISLTSEPVWFTLAEVMSLLFSVTLGLVNWTLSPVLWNAVKIHIQLAPVLQKQNNPLHVTFSEYSTLF